MNSREHGLEQAFRALRLGIGLMAFLAGLDKFTNLLADWPGYVSPAAAMLPVSTALAMKAVGVIEMAVGLAILARWTRPAAYVGAAWLLLVAGNLVLAGFYDVAVRDVILSLAAFALGRLAAWREAVVREEEPAGQTAPARA